MTKTGRTREKIAENSSKQGQIKALADLVITSEDIPALSGELELDQGIWKLS